MLILQKKITAVLTALTLMACMGSLPVKAEGTLADLNGDGVVNAVDAAEILGKLADAGAGRADFSEEETAQMDANGDGTLDATDAALILAYSAVRGTGDFSGTFAEYAAQQNAPVRARPSYADAYLTCCKRHGTYTYNDNALFDLIDFDGDDVPELLASWGDHYYLYRYKDNAAECIIGSGDGQYKDDPGFINMYAPGLSMLYSASITFGGLVKHEVYYYANGVTAQNARCMQELHREVYYYEEMNMNSWPDTEEEQATIPETVRYTVEYDEKTDETYKLYEAQWLENPVMVCLIPTAKMWEDVYVAENARFPIKFEEGETDRFYEEKNFQLLQGKYTYAEMLEILGDSEL